MSTLFISDLHLCAQRPDMTAALVRFLERDAPKADALYVLGDLFEFWIGDDDPNPLHHQVAEAFLALSRQNVPIYFIHGNRDFLLGKAFAKRAGMTLLGDPCVIDLYGERVLLSHGDLLCTLDEGYQKFRRITQQKWLRWLFLRLPLTRRQAIACKMRGQSQMENAGKPQTIMDVTPAAVDALLRQHGCRLMIHGHTHRPAVHDFMLDGKPARRIVLGDWFEQGSVLSCSPQGQRLESRPLSECRLASGDKGCPYDNLRPPLWAGGNTEPCIYSVSVHTHEDEMMGFLTWVVLGLIVGILAKWIMPGKDGGGFFMTVILGVVGAMVGGYVGTLLGMGTVTGFNLPSILIATVGALIVLFVYNKIRS